MKVPKIFRPEKNLDEKIEKLTESYEEHVDKFELEQKILDLLAKFDLKKGILYTSIDPLRFEQSNLPYDKIVYIGIACNQLFENFYRYRFNYFSKGDGIKWLEITDTRPKKPCEKFGQIVEDLWAYHKIQGNKPNIIICYHINPSKYELKFNNALTKQELIDAINGFYCKKFPWLGSKYNLFINKLVYKGLTEKEFLNSNLPMKRIEIKWKNKKGI